MFFQPVWCVNDTLVWAIVCPSVTTTKHYYRARFVHGDWHCLWACRQFDTLDASNGIHITGHCCNGQTWSDSPPWSGSGALVFVGRIRMEKFAVCHDWKYHCYSVCNCNQQCFRSSAISKLLGTGHVFHIKHGCSRWRSNKTIQAHKECLIG